MTRTWADPKTAAGGWLMKCDENNCPTTSETFPLAPDLDIFRARGWYIAEKFGDVCPTCLHGKLTDAENHLKELRLVLSEVKFRTAPGVVHSVAETGWQLMEALDKVIVTHRATLPPLSPAPVDKS